MTRTSSDTRPDGFRRTFIAMVLVLVVTSTLLVALNAIAGPKLESATVDTDRVVLADGQLRLFANEQVGAVASVSVSPFAGATASASGDVIAVEFDRPLRYATDYEVRVDGVTGTFDDRASTLTYEFRTADPVMFYLARSEAGDEIRSTTVTGEASTVVYRAERIQEFARVGELLAVSTLTEAGSSALTLVSLEDGVTEDLPLPASGMITDLAGQADGSMIGFALTSDDDPYQPSINSRLFTVDLAHDREFTAAIGIDGGPLGVQSWQFVPGSTTVLVHDLDSSLVQLDLVTGTVTPLGDFADVAGLSTDAAAVVVTDQRGLVRLSLPDRARELITPSPYQGRITLGGTASLLRDGLRVQSVAIDNEETGAFESYVVRDDGVESVPIFRAPGVDSRIIAVEPSPNDQYVAVEVDQRGSDSDAYPVEPRSRGVTTVVVDIATGEVVRRLSGFAVAWP